MTTQTYTVVGTSVRGGLRKLRYSNGDAIMRGNTMKATGNTEIALFDLPAALTKAQAQAAYQLRISQRTLPTYATPDFDYDTINNTPRPKSDWVDQALKYIENTK